MVDTSGPLGGVRVLDFTHILAGPYATQLLADAGADVMKVEPPAGAYERVRGPQREGGSGEVISSYYAAVNRGKRSLPLDLKNPSGLKLALRLAESADVIIENFAPGRLSKLGVDFQELRRVRPELITVSLNLYAGLDPASPRATRGGLAVVAEGESSLAGQTRDKDGTPIAVGLPLGDMAAGMAAYGGVVTALFDRTRTGQGRHLDISMVGTLFALNAVAVAGSQIMKSSSYHMRTPAYGIFPSKDGHVVIGVNSDSLFQRLAGAMGRPELAQDPRFATYLERDANVDEVDKIVADWTSSLASDEIIDLVAPSGVPCGRVNAPGDVLADAELRDIGFIQTIGDGIGGTLDTPANPLGFAREGASLPRLTEHSRSVLADIGVVGDEVDALGAQGAFGHRVL